MLSSNWHVTLRLTVFEILTVKWPKFRPKISDFGVPVHISPPKEEKICLGPTCTILQNFMPVGATVSDIFVTGQKIKQQPKCPSTLKYGGKNDPDGSHDSTTKPAWQLFSMLLVCGAAFVPNNQTLRAIGPSSTHCLLTYAITCFSWDAETDVSSTALRHRQELAYYTMSCM